MIQYIDKSALVAEIERRRRDWHYGSSIEAKYKREECDDILSFINTLEVKEVDLEKELDYDDYVNFFKEYPEYDNENWGFEETWTFGQYCYKLGLKIKEEYITV